MSGAYFQVVDCEGEAHGNAFIDHCMDCAPRWGRVEREMPTPAGLVFQTRARETGHLVTLFNAKEQDIDADGKYVLLCEEHGQLLAVPTIGHGRDEAAHPTDWCSECRPRRRL